MGHLDDRVSVVVAAGGAAWEAGTVAALTEQGLAVTKRCVDLTDLLATTSAGVARVVVVASRLPGLDADAVRCLHRDEVGVLAIATAEDADRVRRLGIAEVLVEPDARTTAAAAARLATYARPTPAAIDADDADAEPNAAPDQPTGRIVVVWGGAGAPGRTTVASGMAAIRARQGSSTILVDADPYGGAIAQNLGLLDEVSGLLAAARRVNEGTFTPVSFAGCRRTVSPGLEVLTGLPRPDRWVEVRPGVLTQLLETAALQGDVFVDVGLGLEGDERSASRDRLTVEALDVADCLVVVGGAEPIGLARLARGLVDLAGLGFTPDHVVINRMRDTLGWQQRDLVGMVTGYAPSVRVSFLRDDRDVVDRSLVAGRAIPELGQSKLAEDLAALAAACLA